MLNIEKNEKDEIETFLLNIEKTEKEFDNTIKCELNKSMSYSGDIPNLEDVKKLETIDINIVQG
jgi:hypothetical protein